MTTAGEAVKAFPASTDEIREDLLPYMEEARAKVAAMCLNTLEKQARRCYLLDSPVMSFHVNMEEDRLVERRKVWAEHHALRETEKISDLTPERKAQLLKRAKELLPQIDWSWAAYSEVRAIEEENLSLDKPSRTQEILEERYKEKVNDASELLSFSVSPDDILFLNTLFAKRYRRSFRMFYLPRGCRPYREPTALVDLMIGHREFKDLVEHQARTLADVKRLLSIWATECRVERRESGSVVVAGRFEIQPEEAF